MPPMATSGLVEPACGTPHLLPRPPPGRGCVSKQSETPGRAPRRSTGSAAAAQQLFRVVAGEAQHRSAAQQRRASAGARSSCPTCRPAPSSKAKSARSLTMTAPRPGGTTAPRPRGFEDLTSPVRLVADLQNAARRLRGARRRPPQARSRALPAIHCREWDRSWEARNAACLMAHDTAPPGARAT